MTEFTENLPILEAIGFLFVVVMLRANATYWIGRGLFGGMARSRFAHRIDGPAMRRAERFMARWGIFAVPLSFLTVGIQTAVNASAGITRVPLVRYLPAVTVGALIWAVVYATVGLAAFAAAFLLAVRSPWVLAGAAVLIGLGAFLIWRRRTRPETVVVID